VRRAAWLMAAASGTSLAWMLLLHEATGIEPFYPGIAVAGVWWGIGKVGAFALSSQTIKR